MSKKKNGDGIWIHGRIEPLAQRDTKGCVSLCNDDLKKLSPYLHQMLTPVVTLESLEYTDNQSLDQTAATYRKFIEKWLSAWQDRDMDTYASCYSPDFHDTTWGRDVEEYLGQKSRILKRYENVSIDTGRINIIGAQRYVLAYFLMDFAGDHFDSSGVKFVYMSKDPSAPKILNERFLDISKASEWTASMQQLAESRQTRVDKFIESWIGAWEGRDMERLSSLYSPSFPDRESFLSRKRDHLSRYSYVDVTLENMKIERSGVHWRISAYQKFDSDIYSDTGVKYLELVESGGRLLIKNEYWKKDTNDT